MEFKKALGFCVLLMALSLVLGAPNQSAAQYASQAAASSRQDRRPQWHLNGGGSGNNGRNWNAGGNLGAGWKAWESQNKRHSFGVGANYGRGFGRSGGQSWSSKPNYGFGAGYSFKF